MRIEVQGRIRNAFALLIAVLVGLIAGSFMIKPSAQLTTYLCTIGVCDMKSRLVPIIWGLVLIAGTVGVGAVVWKLLRTREKA